MQPQRVWIASLVADAKTWPSFRIAPMFRSQQESQVNAD